MLQPGSMAGPSMGPAMPDHPFLPFVRASTMLPRLEAAACHAANENCREAPPFSAFNRSSSF